jgi:uncharacterized membrane-anchored protein
MDASIDVFSTKTWGLAPHPLRATLQGEIHARPPDPMARGKVISHLVMIADETAKSASIGHLNMLLEQHGHPPVEVGSAHVRLDLLGFRLRWEMHTEFVTWTFSRTLDAPHAPDGELLTARDVVPCDWFLRIPGTLIAGMHVWVVAPSGSEDSMSKTFLHPDKVVGASVAGGMAVIQTDFCLHADGLARAVVTARAEAPQQIGRLVQQVLEIDTYRMVALLGLPVARAAGTLLGHAERELAALADAIRDAAPNEETALLDRLTRLAGQMESHYATTHSRLSASSAYFDLVDRRLAALAEHRIDGVQTLGEFIERRLSPARATCEWAAHRQEALSRRVSRMSNLLRTRVEVEQQRSSRDALKAMAHRQAVQLELQATVEGLSVAAITYYAVGLVGYLTKAGAALGVSVDPELATACAIPVIAAAVWLSLRSLHLKVRNSR